MKSIFVPVKSRWKLFENCNMRWKLRWKVLGLVKSNLLFTYFSPVFTYFSPIAESTIFSIQRIQRMVKTRWKLGQLFLPGIKLSRLTRHEISRRNPEIPHLPVIMILSCFPVKIDAWEVWAMLLCDWSNNLVNVGKRDHAHLCRYSYLKTTQGTTIDSACGWTSQVRRNYSRSTFIM